MPPKVKKTVEYRVFPASLIFDIFDGIALVRPLPDAHLAATREVEAVQQTLQEGFIWIRTDGDHAVFVREVGE